MSLFHTIKRVLKWSQSCAVLIELGGPAQHEHKAQSGDTALTLALDRNDQLPKPTNKKRN